MPAAPGLPAAGGAARPWRGLDSGCLLPCPLTGLPELRAGVLRPGAGGLLEGPQPHSGERGSVTRGRAPAPSPAATGGGRRVWGPRWGHSLPAGWPSAGLRAAAPGAGSGQDPWGPEDGTWGTEGGEPPRPAGLTGGVGSRKRTVKGCTSDWGRAWPGERPIRSRGCGTGDGGCGSLSGGLRSPLLPPSTHCYVSGCCWF